MLKVILFAAVAFAAQAGASPMFLAITVDDYVDHTYVTPPADGASFVLFVGERVSVRVTLGSRGPDDAQIRPGSLQSISVAVDDSNGQLALGKLDPNAGVVRTLDGGSIPLQLAGDLLLRPMERVEWRVPISGSLAPGVYRVSLAGSLLDSNNRRVSKDVVSVNFEVRRRSAETNVEVLRRNAIRSYLEGDMAAAKNGIARLLKAHPRSFEAFLVSGHIAMAEGDRAAAARHYAAAETILVRNEDDVLRKVRGPRQIEQIRGDVAELRKRTPPK